MYAAGMDNKEDGQDVEGNMSVLAEGSKLKWSSRKECIISLLGYSLGLTDIWRVPYLTYGNGGGAFLIPYIFFMLVCGVPLYFLEIMTSQFSGKETWRVWDFCPLFRVVELVGPTWRGFVANMHQLIFAVGELILCWLAYMIHDWKTLQLVLSVPSVVCLFYYCLLPESVRWLHGRGRVAEAQSTLQRIAKTNRTTGKLPSDFVNEAGETAHFHFAELRLLLKTPKLVCRYVIIAFVSFVLGILYTGLSLTIGTLGGDVYISFLGCVIAEIVGLLIIFIIENRVGRKYQHVIGFFAAAALSAIYTATRLYIVTNAGMWISIIAAMIVRMFGAAGSGTVFTYSSELFPTTVRNVTVSALFIGYTVGSMVAPYIAYMDEIFDVSFSKALPAFVFGISSLSAGLLCLALPETLHRSLPQTVNEISSKTPNEANKEIWTTKL